MRESLLTIEDVEPGIQRVTLDIAALYPDEDERERFKMRFTRVFQLGFPAPEDF